MDDPRDRSAGRRAEREYRPSAALGDEVVLEVLPERRVAGERAEALGDARASFPELATQPPERR